MKQYSKLFSVALLLSTAALAADSVLPFLQFRSQGRNTARKIVGTTSYAVDQYDMEGMYGTFDLTLEYDRSFRPKNISEALFCGSLIDTNPLVSPIDTPNRCRKSCDESRCLLIQGLNPGATDPVTARNPKAWLAENFLLPNEFQSTICFKPLVQNVVVNFDWYMGLDKWCGGLYFRLYGPVVNNRTNLKAEETLITPASDFDRYDAGFLAPEEVPASSLFGSALEFFNGDSLPGTITGITYRPLEFAKIGGCGNRSKTGFAELRGEFGWNYLRENYRAGFNIQAAAPTGTRPKGEWLLEPQIGNGKHWELGAGFKALWTMWRSEDEDKHFDFVFEADVTHLFKAKQRRTFDLKNKPNSRYMLAERLVSTDGATGLIVDDATVQFGGEISPVANFSTRDVKVSIGVQGDLAAMFTYTVRGFSWDLGYNFWGMSHEKISLPCDNDNCHADCPVGIPFTENTWALKGDANLFGTTAITAGAVTPANTVALAATEDKATIFSGTNLPVSTITAPFASNPGVDNATAALAGTAAVNSIGDLSLATPAVTPINTSVPPVFIAADDFDVNGAEVRGISNKIFTHFNYTWMDRDRWVPYVGGGVSAEFGSHGCHEDDCAPRVETTNSCDSDSNKFALSQWAIWVKGGVSFH